MPFTCVIYNAVHWCRAQWQRKQQQQFTEPRDGNMQALGTRSNVFLRRQTQELCESRGSRPGLPVANSPYGLCGRKATLNRTETDASLVSRSCARHSCKFYSCNCLLIDWDTGTYDVVHNEGLVRLAIVNYVLRCRYNQASEA